MVKTNHQKVSWVLKHIIEPHGCHCSNSLLGSFKPNNSGYLVSYGRWNYDNKNIEHRQTYHLPLPIV